MQLWFSQAVAPQRTPSHLVFGASYSLGPAIIQGPERPPHKASAYLGEERGGEESLLALDAPPRTYSHSHPHPRCGQNKSQVVPGDTPPVEEPPNPCRGPLCGPGRMLGHWAAYHSAFHNDMMGPPPLVWSGNLGCIIPQSAVRAKPGRLFFANPVCLLTFYLHSDTERR